MSYITNSVDEFFVKLNKMQSDLAKFSQNLDNRSAQIPALLKNFEKAVFDPSNAAKTSSDSNEVEKAIEKSNSLVLSIVNIIESIVVIVFSVMLIFSPTEHHAHFHIILLGIELILEVVFPVIDKNC